MSKDAETYPLQDSVDELWQRRYQNGRDPEATTTADIDTLNAAVMWQPEAVRDLITAYTDVWSDFRNGRCSVCGMTSAQSDAAGYDCAREC